eukprot:10794897-Alexandrium_andersonii.AAC.1
MSASLVGSEMCIRDSARTGGPARPAWGWCARAATRARRGGRARAWAPVSYTHLTLPTICSV